MRIASRQDNRDAKMFLIEAFFDDLDRKIEFLLELAELGHEDEARLLCVCYIDALGLAIYWPDEQSKACFVRVLKEYGGEEVLGRIHPKMLEEALAQLKGKRSQEVLSKISPLLQQANACLYDETEITSVLSRVLDADELAWLKGELWRGTLAAVAYSRFRIPSVHGFRSPAGVSFNETTYQGKPVSRIDFEMLHACLRRIAALAREKSLNSGNWFGHDYK